MGSFRQRTCYNFLGSAVVRSVRAETVVSVEPGTSCKTTSVSASNGSETATRTPRSEMKRFHIYIYKHRDEPDTERGEAEDVADNWLVLEESLVGHTW